MKASRRKYIRRNNRGNGKKWLKGRLLRLDADDFSDAMAFILMQLHHQGGQMELKELRTEFKKLGTERTLNRNLKRLEQLDLIQRENTLNGRYFHVDLRRKVVCLTDLGQKVAERYGIRFEQRTYDKLRPGPKMSARLRKLVKVIIDERS